jgi:cardiolipin synthase A/B
MMKKDRYPKASLFIFILFFIFLLINQISISGALSTIVINEVMYDPTQDDNYNEWIELYNPTNQSINVSGWSITDNSAEDFLKGDSDNGNGTTIIPPNGYAIIADHGTKVYENFSVSDNAIRLYVDDYSIGNGLGNDQDKLILKNSTGNEIDSLEWGYDYPDVIGSPADLVDEGHTLARHQSIDTNNSSIDFYDCAIPTPGWENKFVSDSNLNIELYPFYVPKIQDDFEYSIPFAIKINASNYNPNETYQLKAYVIGNESNTWPATQTWNGTNWQYSYYYTFDITTDEHGNWSDWIYLRLNKDYQEYQKNIERNGTAYLKVKMKRNDSSDEVSKKIYLLDMDDSTSNGTRGGFVVGRAVKNNTFLENKIIIVENYTGTITGIYVTENNGIDDELVSKPGYYKLASPTSTENTIKFYEKNGSLACTIQNVTIEQGDFGVDISSQKTIYLVRRSETLDIPLTVKNTGDFLDIIDLAVIDVTPGWSATLEQEKLSLNSGKTCDVNLHIIPCQQYSGRSCSVTIYVVSEKDVGESGEIKLQIDILAPDLTITTIKIYDENDTENSEFGEGEIVNIKAFLKNLGNENATDFDVMFYYDYKDVKHFIGSKHYDSIGKYQKYPSVDWDTTDVPPGNHTIFVVVDENDKIDELDETNNELFARIELYNTCPSIASKNILITEIYYYAHSRINNEFIAIYNSGNKTANISGLYITNQPQKSREKQTKIVFPENTTIPSETSLYVTQNASAYLWETGEKPDFEYDADSKNDVPQMITQKQFILSNKGSMVSLKDRYNHTIDLIAYGESNYSCVGWNGSPVPSSGSGVILKRNFEQGLPIDTNTSNDWIHPRRYGIGQSDFPLVNITFNGEVKAFVSPDCSFRAIVDEIRKANESIYFNIYEFTNPILCDELIAALRRNVSVCIFAEASPVGGIDDREKFILNRISSHGGDIRLIVNDNENDVYARYTFDHAKYLVIDNKTVIVESCNWAKTGVPPDPTFGNREWGIIVRNSDVAKQFLEVFLDDYNPQRCDSYIFNEMNFSISPDLYMDESILKGSYEPQFESKTFNGNFSATPVFSPDTSEKAICDMIESANKSIYIEQLYIYKNWSKISSPFVERLVNKSKQGIDVKVILNYDPNYKSTNDKCNQTKQYLEKYGIEVKFVFTNWSYFTNVHNKGMIVDNKSVLISSINWNEDSVTLNREAGIIINNEDVARYYSNVFFYDWNLSSPQSQKQEAGSSVSYKNTIYIAIVFTLTFVLIARDWRKRQWT